MRSDAYRQGDEFVIQFDLPGVATDAIDLSVENNVLTLKAQRTRREQDGVAWIARERPHGTFSRAIFLGDSLDTDRLEARYANGVLTVRLPVADKAKPRRIPVSVGAASPNAIDTQSAEVSADAFVGAAASN
ncbi:MAG TPA: Hsp20/alpha crystallin family protein [Acidimicrobiales bacterium]|nr:Hsp20/alpha crystallin family protein [Acidimicrobiales bacterium]